MDQRTVVYLSDQKVCDVGPADKSEPPVLCRRQDAVMATCWAVCQ
jgi:hypothetical protein